MNYKEYKRHTYNKMKDTELSYIFDLICNHHKLYPSCDLLVFGTANIECLYTYNRKYNTIFIEDSIDDHNKARSLCPDAAIVMVKYNIKVKDWKKLLNSPDKLYMIIPYVVSDYTWDIIIVDGPRNNEPDDPGRMSSIYMASRLVKNNGNIFITESNNNIESIYSSKYIGDNYLVNTIDNLAHYNIKE